MIITLYTSRVIINVLGIEDYGIYNAVSGVVLFFGFITSSMSSATSRFLAFAIGENNQQKQSKTFKASFTIHFYIAILVVLLLETLGYSFLKNSMIIPELRRNAADYVFHSFVFASFLTILVVPFTASVLAHEKMNVFAYFEIIVLFLKLAVVMLIPYVSFDGLIFYSIASFCVSLISFLLYIVYTGVSFKESRIGFYHEKKFLMPMLSFSGWDLYGNMSVVARTQGVTILLNIFFGPALNAANAIATTVQAAVGAFSGNILMASKPAIIKSYAEGNYNDMCVLINKTAKYTTLLLLAIIIPLTLEMPFVLKKWLKNVPEYSSVMSISILFFIVFANISSLIMIGIHATSRIKRSSILNGTLYLSVIPITVFFFKLDAHPVTPFLINILFVGVGAALNSYYLKKYIPCFHIGSFFKNSVLPAFVVGLFALFLSTIPYHYLNSGWVRLFSVIFISTSAMTALTYFFLITKSEKKIVDSFLAKRILKKNV